MVVPSQPKIYHITHFSNLPTMVADGGIYSDAVITRRGGPATRIGMSQIKQRRLEELQVTCYPGTMVGEYVPFYFCPRSVMLYLLAMGNHPDLDYKEGQGPIVHLQADLHQVIAWANAASRPWAFSLGNAGTRYAEFRDQLGQLDDINWEAVEATNWSQPETKEGKMAEFLVLEFLPLALIEKAGVVSEATRAQVEGILASLPLGQAVSVTPDWYY